MKDYYNLKNSMNLAFRSIENIETIIMVGGYILIAIIGIMLVKIFIDLAGKKKPKMILLIPTILLFIITILVGPTAVKTQKDIVRLKESGIRISLNPEQKDVEYAALVFNATDDVVKDLESKGYLVWKANEDNFLDDSWDLQFYEQHEQTPELIKERGYILVPNNSVFDGRIYLENGSSIPFRYSTTY